MRVRKLIQRLKGAPAFPVIPIVPIGIVVSNVVLWVLSFRRMKRLETRVVVQERSRPISRNSRTRVAAARA